MLFRLFNIYDLVIFQVLKNYVRQKAEPEGSIARGYVHFEALFFCIESISLFDSQAPTAWEEDQDLDDLRLEFIEATKIESLTGVRYTQIRDYVAQNDLRMEKWVIEYRESEAAWIAARHPPNTFPSFFKWLEKRVAMIRKMHGKKRVCYNIISLQCMLCIQILNVFP